MSSKYALNPHALVRFLEKDAKDFTKDDIIRYVTENEIEMINFRYPGADGRLKTLNFIINSLDHLDNILTCGERVDGSSLFPYIEAGSSDLYVLPLLWEESGIFCRENLSLLSFYKSNIRLYNELILCVLCWNNDLPDKKKVIIPYAFIKRSFFAIPKEDVGDKRNERV